MSSERTWVKRIWKTFFLTPFDIGIGKIFWTGGHQLFVLAEKKNASDAKSTVYWNANAFTVIRASV